eukprot:gene5625-biopygen11762
MRRRRRRSRGNTKNEDGAGAREMGNMTRTYEEEISFLRHAMCEIDVQTGLPCSVDLDILESVPVGHRIDQYLLCTCTHSVTTDDRYHPVQPPHKAGQPDVVGSTRWLTLPQPGIPNAYMPSVPCVYIPPGGQGDVQWMNVGAEAAAERWFMATWSGSVTLFCVA